MRTQQEKNESGAPLYLRDLTEEEQREMVSVWKRKGMKEVVKAYEEGENDIQIGVCWMYEDAEVIE